MSEETIVPEPSAEKRRSTVSAFVAPSRAVLDGFRSLFAAGHITAPAEECAAGRTGTGVEPPPDVEAQPVANHLERAFAFVDVCGFTTYVDTHGTHAAIELLTRFRAVTREVAARRGVRVAKWLGDGVMLVGTDVGPTVAAAAELVARFHDSGIDIHVGLAEGGVLLFEGDDYIGRPVNLAARLCDAASDGEILALVEEEALPDWVSVVGRVTVRVSGVGDVEQVRRLEVAPDVLGRVAAQDAA